MDFYHFPFFPRFLSARTNPFHSSIFVTFWFFGFIRPYCSHMVAGSSLKMKIYLITFFGQHIPINVKHIQYCAFSPYAFSIRRFALLDINHIPTINIIIIIRILYGGNDAC